MKKIIPALAMLLISAIVMSTASFAWFSTNVSVEATGMQVKAQASGSLIIANSNAASTFVGASDTAVTDTTVKALSGVTYDEGWKAPTPTDLANVDPDSGVYSGTLQQITANNNHYVDYVVYIASAGDAIDAQDLTATVNFGDPIAENDVATRKALSVAFFVVNDQAVGTPATAIGLTDAPSDEIASYHGGTVAGSTDLYNGKQVDIVTIAENISIPAADNNGTAGSVIAVTMRVYLDGDAADPDTNICYLNSKAVDASDLGINVTFSIADTTSAGA